MSDEQGFQFTPPQRREKKEFEPPPWEGRHVDEFPKKHEHPDRAQEESVATRALEPEVLATPNTTAAPKRPAPLDDSHVEAMFHQLKAEEPTVGKEFNRIGIGAGVLLVGVGVTFVIWSVVMISVTAQRPGQGGTGAIFGIIVMALGVGFAGTGAWFIFRSLRHQGVL